MPILSQKNTQANNFKARHFQLVLYPDSMVDNWEEKLISDVQLPCCYCIHDKDYEEDNKTKRKTHVHIILVSNNTTTSKSIVDDINRILSKENCSATNYNLIQKVMDMRNMYEYLIHNTDDAQKKNKHLYDFSERKSINNFDIGVYEQLGAVEKSNIVDEIIKIIIEEEITNFVDLVMYIQINCDSSFRQVMEEKNSFLNNVIRGMYQKKSGKYIPPKNKSIYQQKNIIAGDDYVFE